MLITDGYKDVPAGKLASVVTCLEMRAPAKLRGERPDSPWELWHSVAPALSWYRELYRRVGAEWLWYSRLAMADAALGGVLGDTRVEVFSLRRDGQDEGLLELDFRQPGECELAFFGLSAPVLGYGAGRWLMNRAIERVWARPLDRFWVHTCTLDHPGALGFYMRSGFRAYARRVEVADDPRLSGLAPRSAAGHIPIIEAHR